LLRANGIDPGSITGVYITGVQRGSPAATAGLREGDIVQSIDGVRVNSAAEFSERIARHRPGDTFPLTYLREGASRTINVTLRNQAAPVLADNNRATNLASRLGASFSQLPGNIKQRYRLTSGIVVAEVQRGGLFSQIGIPAGTIIISVNRTPVNSVDDLNQALARPNNGIISINGITPDGSRVVINVPVGA
jgi:serine protease Do